MIHVEYHVIRLDADDVPEDARFSALDLGSDAVGGKDLLEWIHEFR